MRNISANIFADEFFGTLNKVNRLLWIGLLLNIADDQGRMIDNVALIRSLLFPYDTDVTVKDIDKGLVLFAEKHKIVRYHAGTNGSGKQLIQIVNWWKFQHYAQWASRSIYPAPENWLDRIRIHEKGGGIALINWETPGGYMEFSKKLPRSKVANKLPPAKKLPSPRPYSDVNDDVKGNDKGRAGGVKDSINGAAKKTKAPLPASMKISKEPKAFENLRKAKVNGN